MSECLISNTARARGLNLIANNRLSAESARNPSFFLSRRAAQPLNAVLRSHVQAAKDVRLDRQAVYNFGRHHRIYDKTLT